MNLKLLVAHLYRQHDTNEMTLNFHTIFSFLFGLIYVIFFMGSNEPVIQEAEYKEEKVTKAANKLAEHISNLFI